MLPLRRFRRHAYVRRERVFAVLADPRCYPSGRTTPLEYVPAVHLLTRVRNFESRR